MAIEIQGVYIRLSGQEALYKMAGLIIGLCSANERRRYNVTLSLIGWAQT